MCFDQQADWVAGVAEESEGPAPERTRCQECGRRVHAGEWRCEIWMLEHEECPDCCRHWTDRDSPPGPDDCPDGCNFGEESTYRRCEGCHLVLAAVEAAELDEGCSAYESRPLFGDLRDALREDWWHGGGRYCDRAVADSPQVAAHLDRLLGLDRGEALDPADVWDEEDLCPVDELGGEG